jgi:hypothetical protein
MTQKRSPAKEVAKKRRGGYWIDHAAISEEDVSWLKHATELTLWNVTVPSGFLGQLPNLTWLDVRGGSAQKLDLKEARSLEYLAVNQVRGLIDLSDVPSLAQLRYLNLYGLAKLPSLPSLAKMKALQRIELGQMKLLDSLASILEAPSLKELLLLRSINVNPSDVRLIQDHPTLEHFNWAAEDVPVKIWEPILKAVKLPKARCMHPEEWFALYKDCAAQE